MQSLVYLMQSCEFTVNRKNYVRVQPRFVNPHRVQLGRPVTDTVNKRINRVHKKKKLKIIPIKKFFFNYFVKALANSDSLFD